MPTSLMGGRYPAESRISWRIWAAMPILHPNAVLATGERHVFPVALGFHVEVKKEIFGEEGLMSFDVVRKVRCREKGSMSFGVVRKVRCREKGSMSFDLMRKVRCHEKGSMSRRRFGEDGTVCEEKRSCQFMTADFVSSRLGTHHRSSPLSALSNVVKRESGPDPLKDDQAWECFEPHRYCHIIIMQDTLIPYAQRTSAITQDGKGCRTRKLQMSSRTALPSALSYRGIQFRDCSLAFHVKPSGPEISAQVTCAEDVTPECYPSRLGRASQARTIKLYNRPIDVFIHFCSKRVHIALSVIVFKLCIEREAW
ncbi:uncharacterized protein MYCFIDRAFT_178628 [Pseudocercospora fijiensis CIRAD86]|uniref:Uncharacterized protein n=1 Tax=Pseudocercospora fijiensis (strain CIRAD86) TaxID=383855 RepID=M2YL72_PSEFD|nr:uncharacterized protein MYCFIDRAFT_178628 [Pseudocercospora fijiensis CIRAD86]EME78485.1 hypothetical protein MYCFIDRAFT_178628 [Pseudocercospora fijiensis CIRAD86]